MGMTAGTDGESHAIRNSQFAIRNGGQMNDPDEQNGEQAYPTVQLDRVEPK